jgi:polysaccharide biosynthesis/export protein
MLTRNTVLLTFLGLAFAMPAGFAQEPAAPGRQAYLINAGDTLEISVWQEPDLQREVLVRPDGAISFPLAGELRAEGRTVAQIREELQGRLTRYIPDLVMTVTVTDVSGNRIFVIGQVTNPGVFVMNPDLDVMQALSLAGGTTPFASLGNIRILRRDGAGQRTALPFDFTAVSRGRSLDQNIVLQSGDVVVVP